MSRDIAVFATDTDESAIAIAATADADLTAVLRSGHAAICSSTSAAGLRTTTWRELGSAMAH